MTVRVAIVLVSLLALSSIVPAADPKPLSGSDWPMYRYDPALTAASPLRGGFAKAPHVAWSVDLGGANIPSERVAVGNFRGERREEFLALSADTVTCRDSRGQVLWKLDKFLNPRVIDVQDFVGDGSRGILLTSSRAGKVDTYIVNGKTGKASLLWSDENQFGGQTRIGKLLPGVAGMQIAAASSGQTPPAEQGGDVRLVSFEDGYDRPRFRICQRVVGVVYAPLILFADLDGSGGAKMVVVSHEQIWAFDTSSGKQTFYSSYGPTIRTYAGTVAAIKLRPEDKHPALVMINPNLPGVKAVGQDGKTKASELWKVVIGGVENQYQDRVSLAPAGPVLVYDLENTGRYLILASIKNEHGDGKKHLVIFAARTGQRLQELPDAEVLSADDLDGDGKPELLFRRGAELHIARWVSESLQTVWKEADVVPVLRTPPAEGDISLAAPVPPRGNVALWREKDGSPRFLLRFPDGVRSCRLGKDGLDKGDIIAVHAALSNLAPRAKDADHVVWDGAKLITSVNGKEVYRYVPPAPNTYLAPPPLVADLAGKRGILVRDFAGDYLLCSPQGKKERAFLKNLYTTPHIHVDFHGEKAGPVVCDVDSTGKNDVVAMITDAKGMPARVIFDGKGVEKRRLELLPGMNAMSLGPTGRLGTGQGRWILLRQSGDGPASLPAAGQPGPGRKPRELLVAYDGRTGKQLWERDHYGHYGKNPVVFRPHFPSAVVDYTGTGTDDFLACSENFYGIIGVKDNKDLVGPTVLSDAVPGHWTAYTYPTLGVPQGKGKPAVYHQGAYALSLVTNLEGRPQWHFGMTRDTAGTWGQFVDLDGDGRREVLHAQPDGVLRCFTAEPAVAGKAGSLRWQFDAGRPVSRMITADLAGDGRTAVLFGCDDGKLYALGERDGKAVVLWSVDLGRRVGEPILADVAGDGRPAILVATEDGRLHCLRQP